MERRDSKSLLQKWVIGSQLVLNVGKLIMGRKLEACGYTEGRERTMGK